LTLNTQKDKKQISMWLAPTQKTTSSQKASLILPAT